MDSFSADVVLNVSQFLSIKDLLSLAATSTRYYYLAHSLCRLRGPELVTVSSHSEGVRTRQKAVVDVVKDAISKIRSVPNLALAFSTLSASLSTALPSRLPKDAIVLEAISSSIQTHVDGCLECKSHSALMMAQMSNASIHPFCLEGSDLDDVEVVVGSFCNAIDWKVFVVYACGSGTNDAELFVTSLQARYPDATVVGGICAQGSVSVSTKHLTKEELTRMTALELTNLFRRMGQGEPGQTTKKKLVDQILAASQVCEYYVKDVQDGIIGIALGGDVPVRSVVSRGVKSLVHKGTPQPSTSLFVSETELTRPGDAAYIFSGVDPPPYHLVRVIEDRAANTRLSISKLISAYGEADMVGIRRPGDDGFELLTPHPVSFSINAFVFLVHGQGAEQSLKDANIDLFDLDGDACLADVESKMQLMKDQTAGERILGAVMFSCSGRGPMAGSLIRQDMADASRFARVFPKVGLCGFYAGGEIGPLALAGRLSVFQTGKASLQGFTAVFALFIVPLVDLSHLQLGDREENIRSFLENRLGRK